MNIVLRKVVDADHPFIFSTYLKNNWYSKSNSSTLKKDTWMRVQHGRLEKLLAEARAIVACLSDDVDVILGYVVQDKDPFVYVKQAWRDPELNLTKTLLKAYEDGK